MPRRPKIPRPVSLSDIANVFRRMVVDYDYFASILSESRQCFQTLLEPGTAIVGGHDHTDQANALRGAPERLGDIYRVIPRLQTDRQAGMEFGGNRGMGEIGDKPGAKNKAGFAYSIFSRLSSEYCFREKLIASFRP